MLDALREAFGSAAQLLRPGTKKSKAEVAPPGYEPIVKALKKKGDINNPFAVAWSMKAKAKKKKKAKKESIGGRAIMFRESTGKLVETVGGIQTQPNIEGPRVKCILISEGLGNLRNMNYYGPEAIMSAPAAFEGKPCYLNHQSQDEMHNLPERRVEDKVGYFKGLHVETFSDGKKACVGELHFDLSESGRMAFNKCLTAIHYKKDFEGKGEYIGLSVASDGHAEPREINLNGETLDVNYVTEFTEADSCDLVTSPARGGAILALIEDKNGALVAPTKEGRMNIGKKLKAALAILSEALKPEVKEKDKKLEEAQKELTAISTLIEADGGESYDHCAKQPNESTEEHHARLHKLKASIDKHLGAAPGEADDEDGDADGAQAPDAEPSEIHAKGKHAIQAITGHEESNKLAVKYLISEAKLPDWVFDESDIKDLAKMKLSEAKRTIARQARYIEAQKRAENAVPSGSPERVLESGAKSGNELLKEILTKGE